MKIQDSTVFMLSASTLTKSYKKDESLKTWIGSARQGSLNRSGVYLNEDGTAGTIQHIDLAV
jgi:hypothetical protein